MLAHVVSEFVVLCFLEGGIVERGFRLAQFPCERLQKEIHKSRIVENAVNVCSHTFVVNDVSVLSSVAEVQ